MVEINRIHNTPSVIYSRRTDVAPTEAAPATPRPVVNQERRQQRERRKHNRKPVVERRVSSDRRARLFDAEA